MLQSISRAASRQAANAHTPGPDLEPPSFEALQAAHTGKVDKVQSAGALLGTAALQTPGPNSRTVSRAPSRLDGPSNASDGGLRELGRSATASPYSGDGSGPGRLSRVSSFDRAQVPSRRSLQGLPSMHTAALGREAHAHGHHGSYGSSGSNASQEHHTVRITLNNGSGAAAGTQLRPRPSGYGGAMSGKGGAHQARVSSMGHSSGHSHSHSLSLSLSPEPVNMLHQGVAGLWADSQQEGKHTGYTGGQEPSRSSACGARKSLPGTGGHRGVLADTSFTVVPGTTIPTGRRPVARTLTACPVDLLASSHPQAVSFSLSSSVPTAAPTLVDIPLPSPDPRAPPPGAAALQPPAAASTGPPRAGLSAARGPSRIAHAKPDAQPHAGNEATVHLPAIGRGNGGPPRRSHVGREGGRVSHVAFKTPRQSSPPHAGV